MAIKKATDFLELPEPILERVAHCFHALSDPTRLKILRALKDSGKTVQELVSMFECTQPNISRHLAIMLAAGLVRRRKLGARVQYRIANAKIFPICGTVCTHVRTTLSEYEPGPTRR